MVNTLNKLALTTRFVNNSIRAVAWRRPNSTISGELPRDPSAGLKQSSQQRGPLRHGARDDVFAGGMRSIAYSSEPVQRGNPQCRGEIAVGTAARGRFAYTQAQLLCQISRVLIERCAVSSFQRCAAEAASYFQLGARQNRLQGTKPLLDFTQIGDPQGAQIQNHS